MADKVRIKDLTEAQALQSGDFIVTDSANGTKKVAFENVIDNTLTTPGKFADAGAVGDALAEKANATATETALAGKVDKVTGKGLVAVDATLTQTGDAADAKKVGDEITHVKQDINELEEGKADASGTSENLTAGNAEQLLTDKGITDKVPYLLRASGGNGADRETDKIVGGTVAWNQVVQNGNFADGSSNWVGSGALTVTDNVATYTASSRYDGVYQDLTSTYKSGHKFFMHTKLKTTTATDQIQFITLGTAVALGVYSKSTTEWQTVETIASATADFNRVRIRDNRVSDWDSFQITNVMVTDLTQMFGTVIADRAYALEQATQGSGIAWLRSMGFFTADYYPFDLGTLKSVEGLTAHSMVGFNQWDEEWEVGGLFNATGLPWSTSDRIRGKNFIPVAAGLTYYANVTLSACCWYDANYNFIIGTTQYFTSFTAPQNAAFMKFATNASYGVTYNHDICINLSDPAKNGEYKPYVKHSYPLDSSWIGMGVIKLDSNNQIYYDGDEYYSDGKTKTRYGLVDLGTLNWEYSNSGYFYARSALAGGKVVTNSVINNMVCTKYIAVTGGSIANGTAPDKSFGTENTNPPTLRVNDTDYSDPDVLKTALNSVYCVYELATFTTEEAEPFQNPQILDPYGTEAYETTGIVPVGHETFYPENLRAKIEGLPFNFATLIAPTESTYKATRAYSTGNLFIVDNILYKATTSIASGGTITPGTNCTATTLAEIIAALS